MDINNIKELIFKHKILEQSIEYNNRKMDTLIIFQKDLMNSQDSDIIHECSNDISILKDLLLEKNKDFENVKKDIISNKHLIGEKFNECLEFLEEEINFIKDDKKLDKICIFIDSMKTLTAELEEIKEELIVINDLNNVSISESENVINNSEYPLPFSKQFSQYQLHNKKGFSIKDFSIRHKKDVEVAYRFFDKDIYKTLEYLQKRHGLCSGIIIDAKDFKNKYFSYL